jgi:hypothetical protein
MIDRRTVAVLCMAAGLAAPLLAKDRAEDLRGKWQVDKLAAFEASAPPFYKIATPAKQKEIRDKILGSMPDMVLEFGEGTVSTKTGDEAAEIATYKVTASDKSTVRFDVTSKKKDGSPSVDSMTAEFVDKDTVKFSHEGDPMALMLKRVK